MPCTLTDGCKHLTNKISLQVVSCKWEANDGDGLNYRAVITAVNAKISKVKVQFLDFGNR